MRERSRKERGIVARLSRQGDEEEVFDRAFWESVAATVKLEVLWDMVIEARIWRGEHGDEPRLQRSVLRVQRGGG
jgi:hypothetical protein